MAESELLCSDPLNLLVNTIVGMWHILFLNVI
jgi:hypothetical protein